MAKVVDQVMGQIVQTELVDIDALTPAEWNPRTIKDKRFKQLCEAIRLDPSFMWERPILARSNGEIYAGNMRYRAAKFLKWSQVPARLSDVSEQQAKERALRDNNQYGEWLDDELGQMLVYLRDMGSDLTLLGFDDKAVQKMLDDAARHDRLDDPPEAENRRMDELIAKYGIQPDQLWMLGEHKLYVGDSLNPENVQRLFNADTEHATLLITDPPYNVGLDYTEHTDDAKTAVEYAAWTRRWFELWAKKTLRQIITPGNTENTRLWLDKQLIGQDIFHMAPWIKTNSTVEGKIAHWWCWEVILFFGQKWGKKRPGDVFDFPITNQTMPENKEPLTKLHPCPKPYNLWKELIEWYSTQNDIIADAFSGSGTTLVAAEQLNRKARVMELSPGYAAVSIERWAQYTKRQPTLGEHDGR